MNVGVRLADDRGSTIPLILGCFVVAFLIVAGSVAAGDAFLQQRNLQSVCDGAAAAAATSADLAAARETRLEPSERLSRCDWVADRWHLM